MDQLLCDHLLFLQTRTNLHRNAQLPNSTFNYDLARSSPDMFGSVHHSSAGQECQTVKNILCSLYFPSHLSSHSTYIYLISTLPYVPPPEWLSGSLIGEEGETAQLTCKSAKRCRECSDGEL